MQKYKYNQYVIPCCIECNSLLSTELETPLSKAFSRGFDGLVNYVEKEGYLNVYLWMALLFIKTHVKDQSLRKIKFKKDQLINEKIIFQGNIGRIRDIKIHKETGDLYMISDNGELWRMFK